MVLEEDMVSVSAPADSHSDSAVMHVRLKLPSIHYRLNRRGLNVAPRQVVKTGVNFHGNRFRKIGGVYVSIDLASWNLTSAVSKLTKLCSTEDSGLTMSLIEIGARRLGIDGELDWCSFLSNRTSGSYLNQVSLNDKASISLKTLTHWTQG